MLSTLPSSRKAPPHGGVALAVATLAITWTVAGGSVVAALHGGAWDWLHTTAAILAAIAASAGVCLMVMKIDRHARRQQEVYRRMVMLAREGIWILDEHATIRFANARLAQMAGCDAEELVGRSIFDLAIDGWRDSWAERFERRRQGLCDEYEFQMRRKDGGLLWAHVSAGPLTDDAGRFVGAMGLVTDISERKRAEEALRASEQQLRAIVDQGPLGIVTANVETRQVTMANPKVLRMLGYTAEQLAGMVPGQITDPQDWQREQPMFAALLAGERESYTMEKRVRTASGRMSWVRATIQAITPPEGDRRLMLMFEDIDREMTTRGRLDELQSQLAQASRRVLAGELAGAIAHEVNQPLTAVATYIEIGLHESAVASAPAIPAVAAFRAAQEQCLQAARVARRMLDFVRQTDVNRQPVCLHRVAEESVQLMRGTARQRRVTLACDSDVKVNAVTTGDRVQLTQVVCNLIQNAIDAIDRAGCADREVTLRVTASEGERRRVVIEVRDSGPGVPERMRDKLFDAFASGRREGVGLGLWITRSIVQSHGGVITLVEDVCRGACFRVELPAAGAGQQSVATGAAA